MHTGGQVSKFDLTNILNRDDHCFIFGTAFQHLSSPLLFQESVKSDAWDKEDSSCHCFQIRRQNRHQHFKRVDKEGKPL